ncbi:MAG: hypothetical protein ACRDOV_02735 [Streptomyces sp.]
MIASLDHVQLAAPPGLEFLEPMARQVLPTSRESQWLLVPRSSS